MRIKDYLSYSQYRTFMSGQYVKVYLEGKSLNSKYLTFGGEFATALELGLDDPRFRKVINKIPKPEETEKEYRVKFNNIPLLGKLDGFTKEGGKVIIDEDKTGKNPWTQKMVDTAEQLTFYAIMVHEAEKIDYKDIQIILHWLETAEDDNGELYFTGRVEHFNTTRNIKDVINIYPKIKRAWLGIEQLINNYIKL